MLYILFKKKRRRIDLEKKRGKKKADRKASKFSAELNWICCLKSSSMEYYNRYNISFKLCNFYMFWLCNNFFNAKYSKNITLNLMQCWANKHMWHDYRL